MDNFTVQFAMVGSFQHNTPPSSTGWRVNLNTEQKAGPALYELGNADEPRKIDYRDIRCLGLFCKISVESRGSTGVRRRTPCSYFVTVLLDRLRYKCLGNCLSGIGGFGCFEQFEGGDGRQRAAVHGLQI